MAGALITLTTDFGEGSPYVAQLKASILSLDPAARLVDLTHSIPPQDILRAALVLDEVPLQFPSGTIHVAVVDPGVGTTRRLVYAALGGHHFLAPDNGLLTGLAERLPIDALYELANAQFWHRMVAPTFHGRDILAPAAAHLGLGLPPSRLGPPRASLVRLSWPQPQCAAREIRGVVLAVDSFGNLITSIRQEHLPADWRTLPSHVWLGSLSVERCVTTYGEAAAGELVALVGSCGRLEIAVVGEHAASRLQLGLGTAVRVTW